MENVATLAQTVSLIMDQLSQGFSMLGDHAIWVIMLPFIWSMATCLIWMKIEKDEEELDRRYLAKAEQNLPKLYELAKTRSTEIIEVRTSDQHGI